MNVFCGLPLLLLSHSCIFSILWPVCPLSLPCLPTVAQFPPLTCCCKPGLKPIQCGNVIPYDPHWPLFYTLTGTTLPIYPGLGLALGVHSLMCSKAAIERSRTRHYIKLEKDALLLKVVALSVSRDILTVVVRPYIVWGICRISLTMCKLQTHEGNGHLLILVWL